jgi:hypothetical protein
VNIRPAYQDRLLTFDTPPVHHLPHVGTAVGIGGCITASKTAGSGVIAITIHDDSVS